MSVTLPPEIEARILRQVEDGGYPDPVAVVDEAMRVLEERDQLVLLRSLLAEAEAEIERGEGIAWAPGHFDHLLDEALEAVRQGAPIPDHVKP